MGRPVKPRNLRLECKWTIGMNPRYGMLLSRFCAHIDRKMPVDGSATGESVLRTIVEERLDRFEREGR